jgi:hypothetical protein
VKREGHQHQLLYESYHHQLEWLKHCHLLWFVEGGTVKSLCVVLRIIIVCGFCVDVQCATESRNGE